MHIIRGVCVGVFPWLAAVCPPAQAVTIEQLTRSPAATHVEISPDGRHLAVRMLVEDKHNLVLLNRETLKQVGGLAAAGRAEIGPFQWANNQRIVGQVLEVPRGEEQPYFYGELFAVNADGSQSEWLFGYRSGESQTGTHIQQKDADYAWADIIDMLPGDERNILISSTRWSTSRGAVPKVLMLDVYSGRERAVHVPATRSASRFFTDRAGVIRVITGQEEDGSLHVQTQAPGEGWVEVSRDIHGRYFTPLALTDDGQSVYALDNLQRDRIGLHTLALTGESFERIYEHERADITEAVMSTDGRSVYALRVDDGYPRYIIFSKAHEEAAVFRTLLQTFAGSLVSIESRSTDGRFWIVRTGTDVDEGAFHLFDRQRNEVKMLLAARPDVDSRELSPMQPVSFESFDGRTIHGYFTPAKTDARTVAPLVVLVHGGPKWRDYWGFDPEVQVLATRGFSVLQVNFRGSTGYGVEFEDLSARQWGNDVQKDIISGTRWAIETGRAESGRICIMGSSFGAYSAVQSALLAPDLFACVVANAGIYDLPLLYREGDTRSWFAGKAYLEEEVGHDADELRQFSPVYAVDRLKAPVFVAHGRQDKRAPFRHALNLKRALDKHDKPYEWFVENREAHGFYDNGNRVRYLEAATGFLRKHLN